jgi:hypothetical protein
MFRFRHSLPILLLLFFINAPGAASFVLQDVRVQPAGEDVQQDMAVAVRATVQIIPQGPTTYIEGYTLVLSTGLDRAVWSVIVLVDGRSAAVFEKSGETVFVDGYLLSYPTSRDVAVSVSVDGYAPSGNPGSPFTVLQIVELNNQGQLVSGSEETVSRRLASSPITPPTSIVPTKSPVLETSAKSGMLYTTIIGGVAFLVLFLNAGRSKKF